MGKWIRSAADLLLTFCVKLPLLVLVALPAYVIGYVWPVAYGAFLWGVECHNVPRPTGDGQEDGK